MAKSKVPTVRTPVGLLSFPHLFQPSSPAEGTDPRYSTVLVIGAKAQQKPAYKALVDAVKQAAVETFGDKVDLNSIRIPFRDAGEKDYTGYEPGMVFFNAWSQTKPGIVDAETDEIYDPNDIWPGQLARLTVRPFAYDVSGNKGVSLALNNVQIVKSDMPRLDGRRSASQDFDPMSADEVDDYDTDSGVVANPASPF